MLLVSTVILSCGSSKNEVTSNNIDEIRAIVNARTFKFQANFAYPLQSNDVILATNALMRGSQNMGGQINLSGNGDFLMLKGELTEGNLSYFGEMRNVGYNDIADNSIIFSGPFSDYKIEEKGKGDKTIVQFDANNPVEQFRIRMVVFNNYKSNLIIYGSNRTAIRYTGVIVPLEE